MTISKKKKNLQKELENITSFKLKDAILFAKKFASKKFDETLDVIVVLGIDAKKSDQQIRGVISLPKMPSKKINVAVFADGDDLKKAKDSGADIVGAEELVEKVKNGEINFDKCIATPKMMSKVSVLGQILGPKGLMPNPKLGTVTNDLAAAIKNIRADIWAIRPLETVLVAVSRRNILSRSLSSVFLFDFIIILSDEITCSI